MNFSNFTGFNAEAANFGFSKEMLENMKSLDIVEPLTWILTLVVAGRGLMTLYKKWRRKMNKNITVEAAAFSSSELSQFLLEAQKSINSGQLADGATLSPRDRAIDILENIVKNGFIDSEADKSSANLKKILRLQPVR